MSAITRDYETHQGHLGRTLYQVTAIGWDAAREEPLFESVDRPAPFRSLISAKAAAASAPAVHALAFEVEHWEIRRGRWESETFDDDEYGSVIDAAWVEDDDFLLYGEPVGDGTIRWESAI